MFNACVRKFDVTGTVQTCLETKRGLSWLHPASARRFFVAQLGMAPAGAGAGLAKTRPQSNPRDWKKPAREQTSGCISAPAPAPVDFGRVSGARGSNNRYNKNVQIHQFKQSNNTFL